jgi:16S rRNA processing protein RimM
MAVVLRLSRAGTHKAPFYHVVATDSRKPRDGRHIEDVGVYDPTRKPELLELKADRVEHWLKVGARPSQTVAMLLKRAKAGKPAAPKAWPRATWGASSAGAAGPPRRSGPCSTWRAGARGAGWSWTSSTEPARPVGLVRIGKVVRAIGLEGFLGVAGSEDALGRLERVALGRPGQAAPAFRTVVEARPQGRLWAVRIEGLADRTQAEGWVGAEVWALREDLGEAGEGRHFWGDLEGLPVVTRSGEVVGRVTGLVETGGVDVLVVDGPRGERLVPLAPYVEVDRQAGRIVLDPPEGLLDL